MSWWRPDNKDLRRIRSLQEEREGEDNGRIHFGKRISGEFAIYSIPLKAAIGQFISIHIIKALKMAVISVLVLEFCNSR